MQRGSTKSSLGPGVIAGIIVAILMFALLGTLGVLLYLRRRRSHHTRVQGTNGAFVVPYFSSTSTHNSRDLARSNSGTQSSYGNDTNSYPPLMSSVLPVSSTCSAQHTPIKSEDMLNSVASRQPSGRGSRKELVPIVGLEVEQPGLEVLEEQPGLEVVEQDASHLELIQLREEQARIQERRDALLIVHALDKEQERIRRRIAEIEARGRTP